MLSLLLAVMMMFSLVACGSSKDDGDEVAGAAKTHFAMGMGAEPTSMDPSQSKDLVTWMFVMQSYETLIRLDWETQEFVPNMATEWKINEDSTEVEFTIREGVTFHNGDPMTMDDVIFSLERAHASSFTDQIDGSIDHFEKIDDTHLKVVLKYGYAPILEVLATPSWGIVCKKAVEEAEAAGQDFGRIPSCGTGAYKMVEWASGDKLVFEAFEDHFAGPPAIKTVEAKLIADQSAGAIALEDGTLDFYYGLATADITHLSELPNMQSFAVTTSPGLYDITFNTTDGVFADKRLRQAVAYAIDREEILLGGQEGRGVVANCFCANAAFGYMEDYEWYEQDQEKAKQLLAEAGYPNGIDVVFQQDSSKTYMTSAEVMQAQLAEVGIRVTFEKMERATWTDVVASQRQFDATLRMTNHAVNDADYILTRRLHSSMVGGANNYAGYQNPEMDALIEEARVEPDSNKRLELYEQCYDLIKEDVPVIPLYCRTETTVMSKDVQGWVAHPLYRNPWYTLSFAS